MTSKQLILLNKNGDLCVDSDSICSLLCTQGTKIRDEKGCDTSHRSARWNREDSPPSGGEEWRKLGRRKEGVEGKKERQKALCTDAEPPALFDVVQETEGDTAGRRAREAGSTAAADRLHGSLGVLKVKAVGIGERCGPPDTLLHSYRR